MDKISINEAIEILGVCRRTLVQIAKMKDWDFTFEGQWRDRKKMYWRKDIMDYHNERLEAPAPIPFEESRATDECREHVAWADSLTRWPSDEEIDARATSHYRYKDLVSVLETRVFRMKDESQALRQPCMSIKNVGEE